MLRGSNPNVFLEDLMFYIQVKAYVYFSKEYSNNDVLQQAMYTSAAVLVFLESFLTVHLMKDLTF